VHARQNTERSVVLKSWDRKDRKEKQTPSKETHEIFTTINNNHGRKRRNTNNIDEQQQSVEIHPINQTLNQPAANREQQSVEIHPINQTLNQPAANRDQNRSYATLARKFVHGNGSWRSHQPLEKILWNCQKFSCVGHRRGKPILKFISSCSHWTCQRLVSGLVSHWILQIWTL